MEVKLTKDEYLQAVIVAAMRNCDNIFQGRKHKHGAIESRSWDMHVLGALGEAAVAKYLGVYWSGNIGRLRAGDVNHPGRRIEVRTTNHKHGRLILHPEDPDDAIFVLVKAKPGGSFVLQGAISGAKGKKQSYWIDPSGEDRWAYFVPDQALAPVHKLRAYLSGAAAAA